MFRESTWSERSSPRPFTYTGPITHIPEEWRSLDFLGFPDYEVSDLGRVRRGARVRKPFRQQLQLGGHLRVGIRAGGVKQNMSVHRLVALAFIPNPEGKPCVAHNDGNPLNNRAANLRWATHQENMDDVAMHQTARRGPKTSEHTVSAIRKLFGTLSDGEIARLFNVHRTTVRGIRIGRRRAEVK